ncbi:MAG: ribosome biogenesis GTP-binding protein YihA/YsxC [Alphaproteobacteria bacterium]|jgi:GTP-binding protein|nr:ribosome biogenesis GTP-binding protein YihA/YsxC [Alphaproteobacteria bacterium]MDP6516610.1 ribosome biogenesis GTP-binding protein YihA/YsxC [Alphaproteobacteria bacterium]
MALSDDIEPAALEAGRHLFAQQCRFMLGVARVDQLPDAGPQEVAFAGRSNVGKSSLINALTGRKALARISNAPGRTREINFYDLDRRLWIVDLPGYGYAKASKSLVAAWTRLVEQYLKGRSTLRRACLLIDSRHELKDSDRAVMTMLDIAAVSYQVVLTKADKLKPDACAAHRRSIAAALARHPAAYPEVFATSARTGAGLGELRAALAALAAPKPLR